MLEGGLGSCLGTEQPAFRAAQSLALLLASAAITAAVSPLKSPHQRTTTTRSSEGATQTWLPPAPTAEKEEAGAAGHIWPFSPSALSHHMAPYLPRKIGRRSGRWQDEEKSLAEFVLVVCRGRRGGDVQPAVREQLLPPTRRWGP